MRTFALSIAVGLVAVSAVGQGTVNFANVGVGLNAPYFFMDGVTRLAGPEFLAQLYVGSAASESALTAVPGPAPFLTGTGAGYFNGGTRSLPGFAPGSRLFFQVRIWAAVGGNSYDEALATGRFSLKSTVFQIGMNLGDPVGPPQTPPATLLGLTSASLVPEPSTIALGILGAAALLFRRRK